MKKQLGIAPATPADAVTMQYVMDLDEATQFPSFVPPSTWTVPPPGVLSWTATAWSATTLNRQYFHPFLVGRASFSCSGAVMQISTAGVGTAQLVRVALYPMDPATGYPNTTAGPLREGSFTPSATGNITVTWTGGNITLTPGTYFASTIYTHTAVTTYPASPCINNQTWQWPNSSGPSLGSIRSIYVAGSGTMKAAATLANAFSVSGSTDCPVVFLKAA